MLLRFLGEDEKVAHISAIDVRTAGERAQRLFGEAIERLFDLIDEGRGESSEPDSISRATAESVGGSIFNQIYVTVGHGAMPTEDIVPEMMYTAVLPYIGAEAAREELQIPPPPAPSS